MKIIKTANFLEQTKKSKNRKIEKEAGVADVADATISALGNFFLNVSQGAIGFLEGSFGQFDKIPSSVAKIIAAGPAAIWRGLEVLLGTPKRKGMEPLPPSTKFLDRIAKFMNLRRPEDLEESAQRIYGNLLEKKKKGKSIPDDILMFFQQKGNMQSQTSSKAQNSFQAGSTIVGDFVLQPKIISFLKEQNITKDFMNKLKNDVQYDESKKVYDIGGVWTDVPSIIRNGFAPSLPTTFYIEVINDVPVISNIKCGDSVSWR